MAVYNFAVACLLRPKDSLEQFKQALVNHAPQPFLSVIIFNNLMI